MTWLQDCIMESFQNSYWKSHLTAPGNLFCPLPPHLNNTLLVQNRTTCYSPLFHLAAPRERTCSKALERVSSPSLGTFHLWPHDHFVKWMQLCSPAPAQWRDNYLQLPLNNKCHITWQVLIKFWMWCEKCFTTQPPWPKHHSWVGLWALRQIKP